MYLGAFLFAGVLGAGFASVVSLKDGPDIYDRSRFYNVRDIFSVLTNLINRLN